MLHRNVRIWEEGRIQKEGGECIQGHPYLQERAQCKLKNVHFIYEFVKKLGGTYPLFLRKWFDTPVGCREIIIIMFRRVVFDSW